MAVGNWHLMVCGVNHHATIVEQREPLQLGREDIASAHAQFSRMAGVKEATIVATCNRIEFYAVTDKTVDIFDLVARFYSRFRQIDLSSVRDSFYIRKNKHAVVHLFRVAAGIDSMVLGENQILGQLKEAYSSACAVKAAGKVLHRLFHQAFRVGKQVRTDTELGKGACSISSATIEMLDPIIAKASSPVILLVGLNKMISLAVSGLQKYEHARLVFANRTVEKARQFARKYNAEAHPLSALPSLLTEVDIVITCTGATDPIIDREMITRTVADRSDRPLVVVDMAIPRDVDFAKGSHDGICLYDLEDIRQFVSNRQKEREQALPRAEEIIDRKLAEFLYWFDHVRHEPLYNGLAEYFEQVRQKEVAVVSGRLPDSDREALDMMTRRLVDKLLQIKIRTSASDE
ncbi:MAG: glutamyl-tRNA reductase [candidate division Zixibacteria bacterium]|nr:glutamyl-tRNA reductase [candidate division Zixibacteria bacterium]